MAHRCPRTVLPVGWSALFVQLVEDGWGGIEPEYSAERLAQSTENERPHLLPWNRVGVHDVSKHIPTIEEVLS